jgi:hypothetical protein
MDLGVQKQLRADGLEWLRLRRLGRVQALKRGLREGMSEE